jgi:hypothetical protein
MTVYVRNFIINQGSDFSQSLNIETTEDIPISLSGYGISSYIRKHSESKNIVAGFGISFSNPSAGKLTLSLGSTITTNIKEGRYVYDVVFKNNVTGKKSIIMEGMIFVRSGITA